VSDSLAVNDHAQCLCGGREFETIFEYTEPPPGEIHFKFASAGDYRRQLLRCRSCGHFLSVHNMNAGALYEADYVDSTYKAEAIGAVFERIVSLPPGQSDNAGRVRRVVDFANEHFQADRGVHDRRLVPSVLDVGSGLCVFLNGMKAAGWDCTALDPDARAVEHARRRVGVNGICGDFSSAGGIGRFDVVTFNKVLEHVEDPAAMLSKAAEHLHDNGFVYVEVPDGLGAMSEGPHREEFFIDHLHIFTIGSLRRLAGRAGFMVCRIHALREPSGKFTLFAFLQRQPDSGTSPLGSIA
jgi:SAM-dependent methyltransferase